MLQKTSMGDPDTGSSRDLPIVVAAVPATDRQRKIALGAIITMAVIFAITLPFAKVQLVRIEPFVLATQSVTCAADLLTAALLFSQYSVYPRRAVLALASGYVFSGLFAFLEACAFPGVFAQTSLIYIGDELNTPAWLFIFWHTVFPLAVIIYVLWKDEAEFTKWSSHIIAITITCVVTATAGLTWVATAGVGYLPRIYESAKVLAPFAHYSAPFLFFLSITAFVLLFARRYTIIDQWLMVVLLAWLPTFAVASLFTTVAFTLGWYIARIFALLAGSALLIVLLAETVGLHARLANAIVRLRQVGRVEHRLAAIVESTDDAIVSTDISGIITTWNRAAERLFGYSEVEVIGRPMAILRPPDRENELEIVQRVHFGYSVDHFETVRRCKDGSLINVSLTASPITESGKIVGASKIIRDITGLKRAEERDSLLQLAQASTGVGVWGWDVRTKKLWVSPELEELYGSKPGSMRDYKDFRERVHPDDIDFVEAQRDAASQKHQRFQYEFRIICPNGETRWLAATGSAVHDEVTGEPIRFLGSNFDITERKRAEERQRLLIAELDHRVKNVLAQVAAVTRSTSQGSRSIDEFLESVDGRIRSMAIAHTLLSAAGWQSVCLGTLVRNEFEPYATGSNVTISGPDVLLPSAETQAAARVLHELATNAAKYGALSISGGRISVDWNVKPNGAATNLTLIWRERGGPPVASEVQSSYGTNLIRNLIPHELGGTVDLVFAKEGVNCRIEIPIQADMTS
jgi:PAS domain S-box-containing protein